MMTNQKLKGVIAGVFMIVSGSFATAVHAQVPPTVSADIGVNTSAGVSAGDVSDEQPITITSTNAQALIDADAQETASDTAEGSMQAGTDTSGTSTTATGSTGNLSAQNALQVQAATLVNSDKNISSVTLSPQQVSLTYSEPAKLFGVFSVKVPVKVSVDATGNTMVQYPWYSFLMATNQAALTSSAQTATAADMSTADTASGTLSMNAQTQLLASLQNVLQAQANGSASVNAATN